MQLSPGWRSCQARFLWQLTQESNTMMMIIIIMMMRMTMGMTTMMMMMMTIRNTRGDPNREAHHTTGVRRDGEQTQIPNPTPLQADPNPEPHCIMSVPPPPPRPHRIPPPPPTKWSKSSWGSRFCLKSGNSRRDGPPEPGILMSVVTFEAMQLRGVSKVATLSWTGHGFGLCCAQLLTLNPKSVHISACKP